MQNFTTHIDALTRKRSGIKIRSVSWPVKNAMIICAVCMATSCKKFVEIPPAINQVVTSVVFANDASATSAVVGLYSQMTPSNLLFMNGALSVYPGLSADELIYNSTSTTILPFYQNSIPSNNTIIHTQIWKYAYSHIYQINACLEALNNSTTITASVKQQLIGEMEFCRALCYFYLTNLFGDIPLVTTTDYAINDIMPRTASPLVYKQMVADLLNAQGLLSTAYPTSGPVRPNKWAATALLARIYLYQNDWANAEAQATMVINSGSYNLVSNLNNVFLANSPEAIWQLIPVNPSYNTAEGATFIPSSATIVPTYTLNNYLLNAFEATDQRKVAWLNKNTVNGVSYYYPYKYKVMSSSTKTEYSNVLRLAEQYLIRAEARAQQGNISNAVADINVIRSRAGLTGLSATLSQGACLAAVAQENRIEFFAEWGHRWFDLVRTAQANTVLGVEKTGWQPYAALYPIPIGEITTDIYLTQNPGY